MNDVNKMSFDLTSQEEKKLAKDWIDKLIEYNTICERDYLDIHIRTEENFLFLEWVQIPYSREWGGEFKYVDEDQVVMTEKRFPDNHYEYVFDDEDYEERLKEFLEENPGWVKTSYGMWTNEIENERIRKEFEK